MNTSCKPLNPADYDLSDSEAPEQSHAQPAAAAATDVHVPMDTDDSAESDEEEQKEQLPVAAATSTGPAAATPIAATAQKEQKPNARLLFEDMSITFADALRIYVDKCDHASGLMPIKVYTEIRDVLRDGILTHPKHSEWSAQYSTDAVQGRVRLLKVIDRFHTKAPSGRHATKMKKLEKQRKLGKLESDTLLSAATSSSSSSSVISNSVQSLSPSQLSKIADSHPAHHIITGQRAVPAVKEYTHVEVLHADLVIPTLQFYHGCGHPKERTLMGLLKSRVIGITRDMAKGWIKRCHECLRLKLPTKPPSKVWTPIPTQDYMAHQQIDCLTFLDRRQDLDGIKRTVLHARCLATKQCALRSLTSKHNYEVCLALFSIWVTQGGPPKVLHSDNGSEFIGDETIAYVKEKCGVKDYRQGAVRKPDTQGCVERYNKFLRDQLESLCADPRFVKTPFEFLLMMIEFWFNSFTHRSTHQSAFEYVQGRVANMMLEIPVDAHDTEVASLPSASQEILDELNSLREEEVYVIEDEDPSPEVVAAVALASSTHQSRQVAAACNQAVYQHQWKTQRNAGVTEEIFKAGQVVLMTVVSGRRHKAIARRIPRQIVLVVHSHPYSKYEIYTTEGLLDELVPTGNLSSLPADLLNIPDALRLQQKQIDVLRYLHSPEAGPQQVKKLSMDRWIDEYLQHRKLKPEKRPAEPESVTPALLSPHKKARQTPTTP